ncbi:MAG: hypothetical protein KGL98_08680 [Gammaproteobacteria bacterium]|nr:hypothetical protein [Gammaproteobacteria bacterium]MDE1983587.1 hypothetical protein [Gammaproteobacteria bacterium]MDE2108378.1 hypothetical protein [Gammaproteobacteria bacterium]MDE2461312.1 hypothetical protein [Gammaproteobacteria bacterium]
MSTVESGSGPARWWGEFTLPSDGMGRWQIGPLQLWVQRLAGEWRVAWRAGEELMQPLAEVSLPLPIERPPASMQISRFSFADSAKVLRLVPALADRPVVVRPELPLFIPAGESTTMFVSTPIWVRIFAGYGAEPLLEIPSLQPSDTWFGPDTRIGELCYASRTLAHTRIEEIIPRPHRAITPVRIRNHANSVLAIERLSVPVPLLTLSANAQGYFWTQSVTLERRLRDDKALLQLGDMTVPGSATLQSVCGPRQYEDERTVLRALSRFFG